MNKYFLIKCTKCNKEHKVYAKDKKDIRCPDCGNRYGLIIMEVIT